MKWGGYSIVEVMIVLAISGAIFVSGLSLFGGQNSGASFDQAMHDLSSEISAQIKEVGTSLFFNAQGYNCSVSGSPPRASISQSEGGLVTTQDCLQLGKVFEALPGANEIYIYRAIGNRQTYSGALATGTASALAETNPTLGIDEGTNLTDNYKLGAGSKIVSSRIAVGGNQMDSSLLGYFVDFNSGGSGDQQVGGGSTAAYGYDFSVTAHDPTTAKACVEGNDCPAPQSFSLWQLCLHGTDAKKQAVLNVSSSPAGVNTNLKFEACL